MVKSSSIVAKRERPEVLSPELKSKVERYVVFWRKQSGGAGRSTPPSAEGTQAASWSERTSDRIRHGCCARGDQVAPFLYCSSRCPCGKDIAK